MSEVRSDNRGVMSDWSSLINDKCLEMDFSGGGVFIREMFFWVTFDWVCK